MTTQTIGVPQPAAATTAPEDDAPASFSLDINSILALLPDDAALDDWFLRFTADNEDLGYQFEIDEHGRLRAMASEGRSGAQRQFNLQYDLQSWSDTGPGGEVVTGNELVLISWPARRAADAGWLSQEQVAQMLPVGQDPHGLSVAPHFVAEIVSLSNSLEEQQAKMEEWIAHGVALGWLIDPFLRQVHIYRPGADPVVLEDPETVSSEPELPGFVFNVRDRIFDLE